MGIHPSESLAYQIWKEAFKEARLRDFKMGRTNLPQAATSTAKK